MWVRQYKNMKRIISALIIATALMMSCTEDVELKSGVSFLTPEPEIYEETAIFQIIAQPFTSVNSLRIPVTLGGTAQKGTNFEISSEYFTLSKDSLLDTIVVSTKVLGTGKTLSLSLNIPEGFTAGRHVESGFKLQDKYGYLTFEYPEAAISDTTRFAVAVTDSTARAKVLSRKTPVSISVNKERSTAVEGVDFELLGEDTMNIEAGSYYASFTVVPLKTVFDDGKDKIVLSLSETEKFNVGLYPDVEITIVATE